MGFFSKSPEEKVQEEALKAKIDNIILTTLDLKQDYDIIDIVISKEIRADQTLAYYAGCKNLKERAAEIGADAVVGVQCFVCDLDVAGTRRWYGTAVRFK